VLDASGPVPVILRPGAVTREMVAELVGACEVADSVMRPLKEGETAPSPGMKHKHYAPKGRLTIYRGRAEAVAKAICDTKAPGVGTYGNTYEDVTDAGGHTQRINFSRTAVRRVYAYMTIRRLAGCDEEAVTAAVTAAVNSYINDQLGVAEPLIIPRLYAVAYNADPELAKTFAVADIYANVQGDSTYTRDEITCPWNGKLSIVNSGGLTITYRIKGAFRKETHAHRGRCAGSRTARDSAP
jgi:hypothetical protein